MGAYSHLLEDKGGDKRVGLVEAFARPRGAFSVKMLGH
jgi:hypothetical protein